MTTIGIHNTSRNGNVDYDNCMLFYIDYSIFILIGIVFINVKINRIDIVYTISHFVLY